jgi:hypothetical protein
MSAMLVDAGYVVIERSCTSRSRGSLGVAFSAVTGAAAWVGPPGLRPPMEMMSAGMIGGTLVYVITGWLQLPSTNAMMALVPQTAYFLAHLLFGLVVGTGFALTLRRKALFDALSAPASGWRGAGQ